MKLQEKIDQIYIDALKSKQKDVVTVVRGLKSVVKNYIIEEGKQSLSDSELIKLIKSEVKKRKYAIDLYKKGGRDDLVQKEQKEIDFLMQFLPEQLTQEQIEQRVKEILSTIPDEQKENKGLVIGRVMNELGDSADGAVVARVVSALMS